MTAIGLFLGINNANLFAGGWVPARLGAKLLYQGPDPAETSSSLSSRGVYVKIQITDTAAARTILGASDAGGMQFLISADEVLQINKQDVANFGNGPDTIPTGVPVVVGLRYRQSEAMLWMVDDSIAEGYDDPNKSSGFTAARTTIVGEKADGSEPFVGLVLSDYIVTDGTETLAEMGYIQTYLSAYGVPLYISRAAAIFGQSCERGAAKRYNVSLGLPDNPSAWEAMYSTSARKPTISDPISLTLTATGSWWPDLVDQVYDRGTDLTIVNGAIGSISFVKHGAGQISPWAAGSRFFQSRTSEGTGDGGDKGDVVRVSDGSCFRCTTGTKRYATLNGAAPPISTVNGDVTNLDYLEYGTALVSGGSEPDWSSAVLAGDTVADGDLVWTRLNVGNSGYNVGKVWAYAEVPVWGGSEADPLGLLARLKTSLDAVSGMDEKWLFLSNGQADAQGDLGSHPTVRGWYSQALEHLTAWGVAQGYKVAIGLTIASGTDEAAGNGFRWSEGLEPAWEDACDAMVDGVDVFRGANLYRALGTDVAVYPEAGSTPGVHPADTTLLPAATAWRQALSSAGW
jgi:hypothetical protein